MEIIGIDVGFGFTKAYNGKNSVIFKSILGDATDIQFSSNIEDTASTSQLHITLDGNSYFLGSYAELQSNITQYTLDQDKLIEDYVRILAVTAAALCSEGNGPLQVVTGLPISYLRRDSKKLKEMILGTHQLTFHNVKDSDKDSTRTITINKVQVIPQPIGSIFNLIFDDQGRITNRELATQKLGVLDVGFKTTDCSIFDRLQYIERGSATMETGISKCFSVIANKLNQESNINIELYRIYKFIQNGVIKIRGKEYNIENLTKKVYSHAAANIAADLNRLWENDWDIDSIILSGGGGLELADHLSPNIVGNVIPIAPNSDVRFNNVQGYCKFGKYKWKKALAAEPEKTAEETGDQGSDPGETDSAPAQETPAKGRKWMKR